MKRDVLTAVDAEPLITHGRAKTSIGWSIVQKGREAACGPIELLGRVQADFSGVSRIIEDGNRVAKMPAKSQATSLWDQVEVVRFTDESWVEK